VSAAGTTYCLNEPTLCRLIRDSGFVPAQRDNEYSLLRIHDGRESPDLRTGDWSSVRARRLHVHEARPASDDEDPVALTVEGA
jgi:cyclic dehypoxanthinyl futalosine synthase